MKTVLLFAVFATIGAGISDGAMAQESHARPAKVTVAQETAAEVSLSYPALVLPSREVELSFRVSGQVIALPVRAMSQVFEGDTIAQIQTRDFDNQLSQLQSQKAQAQAELDALKSGARVEEIAALEAAVDSARAQVEAANNVLNRTRELRERGVATRAQLEAAEAEARVAEASLKSQQESLRIGEVGGRPEEIAAAEATLRGIDVQIETAQDKIDDATLRAPFDGIVARRDIDNFANVQAGQPIVLLQSLGVVHLAFDIPGPDVKILTARRDGAGGSIATFDALPGQEFPAELVEFSVQADSATQTYRGRAAVSVPEDALILPGMVANIRATIGGAREEVTIPLTAVAAAPNGDPLVWLVDDAGKVSRRAVTLGAASGGDVVVTEGLLGGERVVSAGVGDIVEGMTVRPITQVGN